MFPFFQVKEVRKVNTAIVPVSNGFLLKLLDGEHKEEYVTQREGKFTGDTIWARLFSRRADAEQYAKSHGWQISQ